MKLITLTEAAQRLGVGNATRAKQIIERAGVQIVTDTIDRRRKLVSKTAVEKLARGAGQ